MALHSDSVELNSTHVSPYSAFALTPQHVADDVHAPPTAVQAHSLEGAQTEPPELTDAQHPLVQSELDWQTA
jgi:hypothetical protein